MTSAGTILSLAAAFVAQDLPAPDAPIEIVPMSTWVRHVGITVKSDGSTHPCMTWATGGSNGMPQSRDRCEILRALPRNMLLRLRGPGSRDLSLELGEFHKFGDEDLQEIEGRPLHILYRRKVRYRVDAEGRMSRCKVIAETGEDSLGLLRGRCLPGWNYRKIAGWPRGAAYQTVTLETVMATQRDGPAPDDGSEGPTT